MDDETLWRTIYRSFAASQGLGLEEFQAAIEEVLLSDEFGQSSATLPNDFVKEVFEIWEGGQAISEKKFVSGVPGFLENWKEWLKQWRKATGVEVLSSEAKARCLDELLAEGGDWLSQAQVGRLCKRVAYERGKPDPGPGFVGAVYRAAVAAVDRDSVVPLDQLPAEGAKEFMETYLASHDDWLAKWKSSQEDLVSLVTPFLDEAMMGDTLSLYAGEVVGQLGWTKSVNNGRVCVGTVLAGGWADLQGLQVGDRLHTINGKLAGELSADELQAALLSRPVLMVFARHSDDTAMDDLVTNRVTLTAEKDIANLGITPDTMPPGSVRVRAVVPRSWAAYNGVQVGDVLKELNGVEVETMQRATFGPAMAQRPLTLLLERWGERLHDDAQVQQLRFTASTFVATMGFAPSGIPPERVFVKALQASSWADRLGIEEGDQLLELNGEPIALMTEREFVDTLVTRPLDLLFIRRDKVHSKRSDLDPFALQEFARFAADPSKPMDAELARLHALADAVRQGVPVVDEKSPFNADDLLHDAAQGSEISAADFQLLNSKFDADGSGTWSADDLMNAIDLIQARHGLDPFPRAFSDEALRRLRFCGGFSRPVGSDLTFDELRVGFSKFVSRRHRYLSSWRDARFRGVFGCPNCKGCFQVRPDADGNERAVQAFLSDMKPEDAADLTPQIDNVSRLHEEVIKAIKLGLHVIPLPAGAARPALHGRILLEERHREGPPFGVVGFIASSTEQRMTMTWFRTVVSSGGRDILELDVTAPPSDFDGTAGSKPGQVRQAFFASSEKFLSLIGRGRLHIEDIAFILCVASEDAVPPVKDFDPSFPLSIGLLQPRVVITVNAQRGYSEPLMKQAEAVVQARGCLKRALDALPNLREVGYGGQEATSLEVALKNLLEFTGGESSTIPSDIPNEDMPINEIPIAKVDLKVGTPVAAPRAKAAWGQDRPVAGVSSTMAALIAKQEAASKLHTESVPRVFRAAAPEPPPFRANFLGEASGSAPSPTSASTCLKSQANATPNPLLSPRTPEPKPNPLLSPRTPRLNLPKSGGASPIRAIASAPPKEVPNDFF